MKRKVIAIIGCAILVFSFIGCDKNTNITENSPSNEKSIKLDDKFKNLEGSWSMDRTLTEVKEQYNTLLADIESKNAENGLSGSIKEGVKDLDGVVDTQKYLYLDNVPQDDGSSDIESLYYGLNIFGEKMEGAQITFKLTMKIKSDEIRNKGEFNLGNTKVDSYSKIITKIESRDYSELNTKILEALNSQSEEGVVESNVDGLYEEVTVGKDYIVYKLQTKEYIFN